MKYWKQGFYDEPVKGSVEIENEYYYQLLDGQSSGREIKENQQGYPVLVEHEYSLDEIRENQLSHILSYDKSKDINTFTLEGKEMWLDKATRVGLMNSISIEQAGGRTETILWSNNMKYTIPIVYALTMLNALELYALECYNVTQSHLGAVKKLNAIEEIENYEYEVGYPDKLHFFFSLIKPFGGK